MDVPLTSLEAHNGSDAAEGEEFQTKVCVICVNVCHS